MIEGKLQEFMNKWLGKRIDYDGGAFGYQCNDLTRQRLKELGLPQYKALGNNGCKLIALQPDKYIVKPLEREKNDIKKPNQIPKPGDIIIFSIPKATGHIAVVAGATSGVNSITIFEQNAGKGSTTGLGSDACRIRRVTYANVYGRIKLPR